MGWGALMLALTLTACGRVVSERPTPSPSPGSVFTIPSTGTPVVVRVPTPTLIPTPTPSPTPIIYVVQPGDTLYGIALKYGVSVSALQEANGIVDPALLQIGQELVIPAPGPQGAPVRPPTPTPMPLLIQGFGCAASALGSLSCTGEVVNPQPHPMRNVQVQIVLRDGEGRELSAGIAGTGLDILTSGGRSPFVLVFNTIPPGYARADARVVRAEPTQEPGNRYGPVELMRAEGQVERADFVVRGQVRNADAGPMRRINVVVAFYDGQDRLLGFRQVVFSEEPTGPGMTRDFEARFAAAGVETFRVFVEGQR
ncbi:LysM peptidoglycan-binding domain-containing protein [Thermoflexus sp.]|uniref:LysM peptidoglycan-binding domain-containing protein n=1 Tax=Thermoflexus sp. TaxID=1969742 RepID=UPI0025EBDBE1|nr:LysM domain-containing protein [Thermoflexus sp.]MDW8181659.1 LysM domain-containing protein [Anaerolineae bacterium]MCS6963527.1 LysM peptidoglycan-binding domain-containing protein [Thermoflexus sp.]MCS7352198.1 LysM peptidoglycan-binding domain-containing protein [Thermoflexus sp.]MCX7690494.1 LysM peptidoglycan-binding domain-containing protein [Thermoflexus sp.]MDW8185438.1 LysM domain-containing protein [Anaerolineae bacterium]